MRTLGIDPGEEQSAYVVVDSNSLRICGDGIIPNTTLLDSLDHGDLGVCANRLAIEKVEGRGKVVPQSALDTNKWAGRFIQAWGGPFTEFYPRQIRIALCGTAAAKPKNIRQAIIDRYPATGGGYCPQVGIKSKPGPLYGITSHEWAALAVALTYLESCGSGK